MRMVEQLKFSEIVVALGMSFNPRRLLRSRLGIVRDWKRLEKAVLCQTHLLGQPLYWVTDATSKALSNLPLLKELV